MEVQSWIKVSFLEISSIFSKYHKHLENICFLIFHCCWLIYKRIFIIFINIENIYKEYFFRGGMPIWPDSIFKKTEILFLPFRIDTTPVLSKFLLSSFKPTIYIFTEASKYCSQISFGKYRKCEAKAVRHKRRYLSIYKFYKFCILILKSKSYWFWFCLSICGTRFAVNKQIQQYSGLMVPSSGLNGIILNASKRLP